MTQENRNQNYKVCGIGFVVEEAGKGAKLLFRYPSHPQASQHFIDEDSTTEQSLFFTLPSRVMAKLFRPKHDLCDRHMTLTIKNTLFCCRAALMNGDKNPTSNLQKHEQTHNDEASLETSNLVLFSIIVALEKPSNFDNINTHPALMRHVQSVLKSLCSLLLREERRYEYVSKQTSFLVQTLKEEFKFLRKSSKSSIASSFCDHDANEDEPELQDVGKSSFHSIGTAKNTFSISLDKMDLSSSTIVNVTSREKQQTVLETMMSADISPTISNKTKIRGNLVRELAEVYHLLSSTRKHSIIIDKTNERINSNIVFINSHVALPIQPLFTVFQNNLSNMNKKTQYDIIRPYHTLLFPNISPTQLISNQTREGNLSAHYFCSENPQKLNRFLRMTNPQKQLSEIAQASALPLQKAIELSSSLLSLPSDSFSPPLSLNGNNNSSQQQTGAICIISQVISAQTRFVCQGDDSHLRIKKISQKFSEKFRFALTTNLSSSSLNIMDTTALLPEPPSIFIVVASLTAPNMSLGKILDFLSSDMKIDVNNCDSDTESNNSSSSSEDGMLSSQDNIDLIDGGDSTSRNNIRGNNTLEIIPSPLVPFKRYLERVTKQHFDLRRKHNNDTYNSFHFSKNHRFPAKFSTKISSSSVYRHHRSPNNRRRAIIQENAKTNRGSVNTKAMIQDLVFSMAVWLRSHQIIVDMKDYLISTGNIIPFSSSFHEHLDSSIPHGNTQQEQKQTHHQHKQEEVKMYNLLLQDGCLSGKISTVAICWRYGWESRKLEKFIEWSTTECGDTQYSVEVITRKPFPGDDWGAP